MIDARCRDLAARLIADCRDRGQRIAIAESCTGGLIGGCLTAVAGSSDVFDCGFVTYSNVAKTAMLGVPKTLLAEQGAVCEPVARAMAEGVLANTSVEASVAVTGIAGPGGGSAARPVGLVHFAAARRGRDTVHERHVFPGDRDAVRTATVAAALLLLGGLLED